jgi:UDP-glucose 4-epimerase
MNSSKIYHENETVRWLITGGCGFIGTSLIAHLKKETPAAKIRVLDNLSVGTKNALSGVCNLVEIAASSIGSQASSPDASSTQRVELVAGDIRDYDTCHKSCNGVDILVHLAANTGVRPSVENPKQDMETNVVGTFNMLEASRVNSVKKFIFASSGAPIGETEPPIHEEIAPKPVSPYGASKLGGEAYCSAYYRTFGVKTIALRFGNVYGTRSKHKISVIAKFFKEALAGKSLEIYGDGNQTRDFIFIKDLVQAIMKSSRVDAGGEIFQIATYKETTINEIADEIKLLVEKECGRKVKIIHGKERTGDVKRNYSDITKARNMLGFEPMYDLKKGLEATFEYFKKRIEKD